MPHKFPQHWQPLILNIIDFDNSKIKIIIMMIKQKKNVDIRFASSL